MVNKYAFSLQCLLNGHNKRLQVGKMMPIYGSNLLAMSMKKGCTFDPRSKIRDIQI